MFTYNIVVRAQFCKCENLNSNLTYHILCILHFSHFYYNVLVPLSLLDLVPIDNYIKAVLQKDVFEQKEEERRKTELSPNLIRIVYLLQKNILTHPI